MAKKARPTTRLTVVLLIDPQEMGEVAEWQDRAKEILDRSNIPYEIQHVRNDLREGTFTPMLITERGGYTGLDRIELYAEASSNASRMSLTPTTA